MTSPIPPTDSLLGPFLFLTGPKQNFLLLEPVH